MKKLISRITGLMIVVVMIFASIMGATAQTLIFSEDWESYALGTNFNMTSDVWKTWDINFDTIVVSNDNFSDNDFLSGNKFLWIDGEAPVSKIYTNNFPAINSGLAQVFINFKLPSDNQFSGFQTYLQTDELLPSAGEYFARMYVA